MITGLKVDLVQENNEKITVILSDRVKERIKQVIGQMERETLRLQKSLLRGQCRIQKKKDRIGKILHSFVTKYTTIDPAEYDFDAINFTVSGINLIEKGGEK